MKTLNKLTAQVAKQIHSAIIEQVEWIKNQEEVVTKSVMGNTINGFNLRQNVQALETGKSTLSHLKTHFESFTGITYDSYCEGINVEKVITPEEKLLEAIKELVSNKKK